MTDPLTAALEAARSRGKSPLAVPGPKAQARAVEPRPQETGPTEARETPPATGVAQTPHKRAQPPFPPDFTGKKPPSRDPEPGQDPETTYSTPQTSVNPTRGVGGRPVSVFSARDPQTEPQKKAAPANHQTTHQPTLADAAAPAELLDDPLFAPTADPHFEDDLPDFPPPKTQSTAKPPTHPKLSFPRESPKGIQRDLENELTPGNGQNLVDLSTVLPAVGASQPPDFTRFGRSATSAARVWLACTSVHFAKHDTKALAKVCHLSVNRFRDLRRQMSEAIGSYWAGDLSAHQEAFNEALVASMKVVGQEGARDRKLFAQLTGRLLDPRLEELRRADRANADQRQGLGDPLATALDRARAARRTQDVVIDAEFETKEGGHHG